jgi:putative component of membrane protein insertase Oxa1/YidC/SpoIIIJ protein YidD
MQTADLTFASQAAESAIVAYQQYVSPFKGFRCAHRALHGGPSCSEFARRLVVRRGVGDMLPLLIRRFDACTRAAMLLSQGPVLDYQTPSIRVKPAAALSRSGGCWQSTTPMDAEVACCMAEGCFELAFFTMT